jgi:hypothetical protein
MQWSWPLVKGNGLPLVKGNPYPDLTDPTKPNENQWAKGSINTQGLRCCDFSLANGSEGPNQAFAQITWENFSFSNPTF